MWTRPSLPVFVYQSLPAVMSLPPLLSVTVTEWVPIIVTVNMTTDAAFAVTTPDLRMKDGLRAPPRPRMTWPLIVSFVNIANCGYANQIGTAVPLWIEALLQVTLPSERMMMEGRFERAYIRPSRRFLEASLEPNRQYYCHLWPSKNFFS